MATIRTCDRCRGLVSVGLVEIHIKEPICAFLFAGDLCINCRRELVEWLKPIPEGPQKRKEEA